MNGSSVSMWAAATVLFASASGAWTDMRTAPDGPRRGDVQTTALDAKTIEAIALATEPPSRATAEERAQLGHVVALLRQDKQAEANSVWIRMMQPHAGQGRQAEIDAYVLHVLNRAYIEPDADLEAQAAKVRSLHEATHVAQQGAGSKRGDAQLASVELQNMLQKQQPTYNMISNVMKSMHEAAKSSIRNMK